MSPWRSDDGSWATYQIVINVDGIVEHSSPVKGSVSLDLVSETFSVWVCLPIKTITITPTRWSVQVEINSMSNQVIWVGCWWNDGTTNVLAFSSESVGDPDGYLTKWLFICPCQSFEPSMVRTVTRALSGKTIHFVHFRFESGINFDGEPVVSLDSCRAVGDQVAAAAWSAATRGTAALSLTWTAAETTLVTTGRAFICIVLTFTALWSTWSIIVTVFEILARSVTWLTASDVTCTTAKTSFPTSSAKIVIPVQACASNTSTLCI